MKKIKVLPLLTITGTLLATPNTPTQLQLTPLSSHSVSIQWQDNSNNETGFKIFRDNNLIATTPANTQSYVDDGLSAHTTYQYTIKATDDIPTLSINEILASNKATIQDPDYGKYADYIELYNANNQSLDLSGYGLSDTEGGTIWKIPQGTTIPAKGYLLIWADKKANGLHTDFKLSSDGEAVILYDNNQNVIDKIIFTKQYEDIALGRDTNSQQIFLRPTPHNENDIAHNQVDPTVDTPAVPQTDIYINEFMAANVNHVIDQDYYEFSDWIELHNKSSHSINIGGYKISDDPNKAGYTLPSGTTIAAHGNLIIWADKKDHGRHTNFSLKSDGESIILTDKNGQTIDQVNFPDQKQNISYGRDQQNIWGFMLPSFRHNNQSIMKERSKKIQFSQDEGFYNSTISVALSTKDQGEIHYTKDGSTPTKTSTTYTSPISLSKTTVLRAISFKAGLLPSKVKTKTYFIEEEQPNNDVAVLSLSLNDDYLHDNTVGIYVRGTNGVQSKACYFHMDNDESEYRNFNQDWKRPVSIEYFTGAVNSTFHIGADISISGQCSRYNRKKSFSIDLDGKYGDDKVNVSFYNDKPTVTEIEDFKLRTGQSGYGIRDIVASAVAKDGNFNVEYQSYHAARVYMNGEYWGMYNIREKKGKSYLKDNYPDIDEKQVDIIAHVSNEDRPKHGNKEAFNRLYNFVEDHSLTSDANYQTLKGMIDEDNLIDYLVIMLYSGNEDWLYNNTRMWRERKAGAKWRWMLDDIDDGFIDEDFDSFAFIKRTSTFLSRLYRKLIENSEFRHKFKDRFNHHINTTFSEANMLNIVNDLASVRSPYMNKENSKWGIDKDTFNYDVNRIKSFVRHRLNHIQSDVNQL